MPFDLTLSDEEHAALVRAVRKILDEDRFPLAPRLDPLKAVLAKLDPPAPRTEPLPPLRPGMGPSRGQGRRRR
jgi:hypothetical protein